MMNAAHDFEEKKKNSINITYYPFSYGLPRELKGNPHPLLLALMIFLGFEERTEGQNIMSHFGLIHHFCPEN